MHSTSHLTAEMMRAVLDRSFTGTVTQRHRQSAKHLHDALVGTDDSYASILFDMLEMSAGRDKKAIAEMAFLVGLQAGYELGIDFPPPPKREVKGL